MYIKNLVEPSDELFKRIDAFICQTELDGREITHKHKSRLYMYFAVTDKFTTLKLAEAAKAGAFNFECVEMDALKSILHEIRTSC